MARAVVVAQLSALPLVGMGHSDVGGAGCASPARACLLPRALIAPVRSMPSVQSRPFLGTPEGFLGEASCAPSRGHSQAGGILAMISSDVAAPASEQQPSEGAKDEVAPVRKGKRIAMFVEPSPFAYICGYKNRFQNLIRFLQEQGDEVLVVTTHHGAPAEWYGAKVVPSWSFPCPFYPILPLSLAASPRIFNYVKNFQPDLIHVSTPGIMCFGALLFAKLLSIPIVMSYHTHVPKYIPQYTFSFLVEPMWAVIRFLHNAATLTLATSEEMRKEMVSFGAATVNRIKVWRKGVDAELFNPRFASEAWRNKLSDGQPDRPLIVHVGRLGAEKNLPFLKEILHRIPEARLAFVGDGPARPELEQLFQGTPTVFTGMLSGEDLSAAYASADAFFTPSESETLGFVVLEAMASGTPVVAARAGGIPDIVDKDGETGFLYTPGDVDDAVTKLRQLLFDRDFNAKMAAAGRADVENYDWRASTRQVSEDGYNTALRLWQQSRKATSDWWPWWTKKAEWQA